MSKSVLSKQCIQQEYTMNHDQLMLDLGRICLLLAVAANPLISVESLKLKILGGTFQICGAEGSTVD
jgi:hypothetical protein